MGELMVDFSVYGWFPHVLPSELGHRRIESDSEEDVDGGEDHEDMV
jgi:hypothetical protein